MGKTLFEKVWDSHVVGTLSNGQAQLLIDTHLVHEVTSPQAFGMLRDLGLKVGIRSARLQRSITSSRRSHLVVPLKVWRNGRRKRPRRCRRWRPSPEGCCLRNIKSR